MAGSEKQRIDRHVHSSVKGLFELVMKLLPHLETVMLIEEGKAE